MRRTARAAHGCDELGERTERRALGRHVAVGLALADEEEQRQGEDGKQRRTRYERALRVAVGGDRADDHQRGQAADEADGNADPRHARPVALGRDGAQQRVVLRVGGVERERRQPAHDEREQDRLHHAEQPGRRNADEREHDEYRLVAPAAVGERADQRQRDDQRERDGGDHEADVDVGLALLLDDPVVEVPGDDDEREDRVREVVEHPADDGRVEQAPAGVVLHARRLRGRRRDPWPRR